MLNINEKIALLENELNKWDVPGMALTVVKDGEVLYAGGVGSRDNAGHPVTGDTLFQIASCSKAFTAALAGVLATEGLLDFNTPVVNYIPGFQLNDDYATMHLTIRDFLSHRSGLPRHEYAWYGSGFSRDELIRNLKDLPLNQPIRYKYQYSNFNYLIVGAVIEQVTGKRFEDVMLEKLLLPLGMNASHVYLDEVTASEDHTLAFDHTEEYSMTGIREIPFYSSPAEVKGESPEEKVGDPTAPAGCIVSNAKDMVKWLEFNLNLGRVGEKQLVREDIMQMIHSIHVSCGEADFPEESMPCYGLGWEIFSHRGHKTLEHGGNLNGLTSSVAFVPDLKLGIFTSANMNVTMLNSAVFRDFIDAVLDAEDANWYEREYEYNAALFAHVVEFFRAFGGKKIENTVPSHELSCYAGTYEAPGYRRFRVDFEDGTLKGDFNTWTFDLVHHHYDSFATTAPIGELPSGVIVTFGTTPDGEVKTLSVTLGGEQNLKPIVFTKA